MPEKVTNCPLCERDQFAIFDQRDFRGFEVINVLCSNCGLVFQTPRKTDPELKDFYQDQYRLTYQGQEGPNEKDLRIQKARAENLVKFMQELGVEEIDRYMDIGSSTGLLMEEIQTAFDCQVVGIEPGAAYREFARGKGLEVYEDLNQIAAQEEDRFDLVSMIHVLEHISDPVGYLITLREKCLTKSAKLLIEVPNLYAHDSFELAHLTSFSRETLTQVLKKAGYGTVFIERHGYPRSKLIPLYITLLAEPAEVRSDQLRIDLERWVRMKRRAGFLHRRVIERFIPKYGWVPEYRA
jgi:SAM-dependent methyltransferase